MKPVVTWVVVANARAARVLAHLGPGKGVSAVSNQSWQAPEAPMLRDKAGIGHSIAGPGVAAVEQTQPQALNDSRFAKDVIGHLSEACLAKKFDRLILISGPYMLGLLRSNLDAPLRAALLGEIPKDLSAQPLEDVETHLGKLIAV